MRRYRFRLEQVRDVRRLQEEVALAAFQRAEREAADAARVAAARRERLAAEAAVAPSGSALVFVAGHERLARGAEAVEAAGQAVVEARRVAAMERAAWSEAARRVAALDRLDERQRDEHALDVLHHFERQVDDIVNARNRRDA
ncbi:MAG TPA: hypothetical protein VFJ85_00330 [Acidimicrobiales bacterium]|nr:hypothetical protein [Acidimicrobiales bacterium]